MPSVIRHHAIIAGVVSGLVPTVVLLAVCASCHQSRRERRRLQKLSTGIVDEPTPTHQRPAAAAQLFDVDDHGVTRTGGASTGHNHHDHHGWTALANGGQCIRRDDGLTIVEPRLTANRPLNDDRPTNAELPFDVPSRAGRLTGTVASTTESAAVDRHNMADRHTGTVCPPLTTNTVISAVATIEKRPSEASTSSPPRTDDKLQYPSSRFAPQSMSPRRLRIVEAPLMDTSPTSGRRICPGWSASVRPVAPPPDWSSSRTLARPNCLETTSMTTGDWQRPASVRWTAARSTGRRAGSSTALTATRSTSQLYDDVRPRLGATHSIVF